MTNQSKTTSNRSPKYMKIDLGLRIAHAVVKRHLIGHCNILVFGQAGERFFLDCQIGVPSLEPSQSNSVSVFISNLARSLQIELETNQFHVL